MQIVSKELSFTYNPKSQFKKQALKDISLTINEGDFFGIIGQTGSGKSTFIQHLNGLIPVQSGHLTVGDFDLSLKNKKDKKKMYNLRSKVGMVFQYPESQLFAETVFEDVAFGLRNFFPEKTEQEIEVRVKEAIELVGLDYDVVKNKSPFELSGGQKRRVAIAGVLVTEPEVLVLDEPVAGLDPVGKRKLMNLLHSIHGGKLKTIVIVSHDMDEVVENCNRVAVFSKGQLLRVDTPKNIFSNEELLKESGLELPITAKMLKILNGRGVDIDSELKIIDFINAVKDKYLN